MTKLVCVEGAEIDQTDHIGRMTRECQTKMHGPRSWNPLFHLLGTLYGSYNWVLNEIEAETTQITTVQNARLDRIAQLM